MRTSLCILPFVALCLSPQLASCDDSASLLEFVGELDDTHTVLIVHVRTVENAEVIGPNGRARSNARIIIDPQMVLFGDLNSVDAVYGYNAFTKDKHGNWSANIQVGKPWIKPGETVLIVTKRYDNYLAASPDHEYHKIRKVFYLNSSKTLPVSHLHTCTSSLPSPWTDMANNAKSARDLYPIINNTYHPTGVTVKDVVDAISLIRRED